MHTYAMIMLPINNPIPSTTKSMTMVAALTIIEGSNNAYTINFT